MELLALLDVDLERAEVLRLEDPVEDYFLMPIATPRGEVSIFMGTWAHSAFYLEALLQAFTTIADNGDAEVLESIRALLLLSGATAMRAGLGRRVEGGGLPHGRIRLPGDIKLKRLARTVHGAFRGKRPNRSPRRLRSRRGRHRRLDRFEAWKRADGFQTARRRRFRTAPRQP